VTVLQDASQDRDRARRRTRVLTDWCGRGAEGLDPQTAYRSVSTAVARTTPATGHRLLPPISRCSWPPGRGPARPRRLCRDDDGPTRA
jgi:hypothetical protein